MNRYSMQFKIIRVLKERLLVSKVYVAVFQTLALFNRRNLVSMCFIFCFCEHFKRFVPNADTESKLLRQIS